MSASTTTSSAAWRRRTWTGSPSSTARAARRPATGRCVGQIDAVAGAVAARGLGVHGVAAILCPNVPAFAVVFHGLLRAGATVTTINSLYTADEIAHQLGDAGAEWLFTVSALLPAAREAAARAGIPADRLVVLDGAAGHPSLRDLLTARRPGARRQLRSRHPRGRAAVLLRDHRPAQGRDAQPPQPRRERASSPAGCSRSPRRTGCWRCCRSSTSTE